MRRLISPCLWFDNEAEDAANFYTSLFKNARIDQISRYGNEGFEIHGQEKGKVLTVGFYIEDQYFTALNGGSNFKLNPSISLYVVCEKEQEVDFLWENLSVGGSVMMPLDEYNWSKKYGWLNDRFGVSWQIILSVKEYTKMKISPAFLFTGSNHPKAEEAIQHYTSIFPDSQILGMLKDDVSEDGNGGGLIHAQFLLYNQTFVMNGSSMSQMIEFNEAFSFQVFCDSQEEIDYYWYKLTDGGTEGQCGWLKDRYGISWQVIPSNLGELMGNPETSGKIMNAFLAMKKFDLNKLRSIQ